MERLLQMLGVLAALYVAYRLGMAKWDYTSPQKRQERKTELKEAGLSTRFYFMHARTQGALTLLSGGLFTFYWLYKQWQYVLRGFKRADGTPLQGGALRRAVGGVWSFFALAELINRTCEYMRKPTSWPAWLWGTLWLGGVIVLFCPVVNGWKIVGYVLWCLAPAVYQRRLNTLTSEHISAFPRTVEIIVTLFCAACVASLIAAWRVLIA